jgi:hypothetical protein
MIDDDRLVVMIIPIAVALLDYDGVVVIPMVAIANDFTIAIPRAIWMAVSDGHTDRTDADTDFFRAGRHRETNSSRRDGYYCKTLDHRMLLKFVNYRKSNSR